MKQNDDNLRKKRKQKFFKNETFRKCLKQEKNLKINLPVIIFCKLLHLYPKTLP